MKLARLVICFLAVVFAGLSAYAQSSCSIVYGKDWAFLFATPQHWLSHCSAEQQAGVPVALWPEGTTFANATTVMYVNVSPKVDPSLGEFVKYSQSQFRRHAPRVVFAPLKLNAPALSVPAQYFTASGDPGGNFEHLAYVEGPTAYFIVVLSARSAKAVQDSHPAFLALLKSFVPMAATVQK